MPVQPKPKPSNTKKKIVKDSFTPAQPGYISIAGETFFLSLSGEESGDPTIIEQLSDDSLKGDLAFQLLYLGGPTEDVFKADEKKKLRLIFRSVFGLKSKLRFPCKDADEKLMVRSLLYRRDQLLNEIIAYDDGDSQDAHARYMRDHLESLNKLIDEQIPTSTEKCVDTEPEDPNAPTKVGNLTEARMLRLLEIFAFLLAQGRNPLFGLKDDLPKPGDILPRMAKAGAPGLRDYEQFYKNEMGNSPNFGPTLKKLKKVLSTNPEDDTVNFSDQEIKEFITNLSEIEELFGLPNEGTPNERKDAILDMIKHILTPIEKELGIDSKDSDATIEDIDSRQEAIVNEIKKLKKELEDCIQKEGTSGSTLASQTSEIARITREIAAKNTKIADLERDLAAATAATGTSIGTATGTATGTSIGTATGIGVGPVVSPSGPVIRRTRGASAPTAAELAAATANVARLNAELIRVRAEHTALVARGTAMIEALEAERDGVRGELDTARRDLEAARVDLAARQARIADLEAQVAAAATPAALTALQYELANARRDLAAEQARIPVIEAQILAVRGDAARLQGELTTAQGEAARLQGELTTAQGEVARLQPAVEAANAARDAAEAALTDMTRERDEATAEYEAIFDEHAVTNRLYHEAEAAAATAREEAAELNRQLEVATAEVHRINRLIEERDRTILDLQAIIARLREDHVRDTTDLEEQLAATRRRSDDLQTRLTAVQAELDRCLAASALELASHQAAQQAAAAAVREAAEAAAAAAAAAETARESDRVSAEERARLERASVDATRVAEAARIAQEASQAAAAAAEQRVAEQQRVAEAAEAALRTELEGLRKQVATAEAARENATRKAEAATREAEAAANETRRTQAALAAAQAQGSASQADINRLTAAVAAATTREQAAQVAERAARSRIAQLESEFVTERGQATTDLVSANGIIGDLYQFLLDKNDQLGDEKIDLPTEEVNFDDDLFAKLRDLLNKLQLPQQDELERLRRRITELESQLRENEVNKVFIKDVGSLFGIEDTDFTQLRTRLVAAIINKQQAFVDKNKELKTLIKKVLRGLRGFLEGSGITVTDLNFPDDPNDATITALMGQINTKKRERDEAIENAKQAELDAAQARVEAAEARAAAAEAAIQTERQRASAALDTAGQKTVDAEAATRRVALSNQLLAAAEARVADAEARANEAEARANEADARAAAATASKDLITPCLLNTLHFILFSQFKSEFVTFLKGLYDTIPKEDLPVINDFFLKTVMSIKAGRTVPRLLDNSAEIDRLIQPGPDSGRPVSPRIGVGSEARAEVSATATFLTNATQYTSDMIPTFEHFVGRVDFFKHKFTPDGLEVSEAKTKSMIAVTMLFLASFHGQVNSDEFKARLGEAGCEYQEPTYTESTYPGQAPAAPVVRVDSDAELARRRAASAAAAPVPQSPPTFLDRFGLGVPPPTPQAPLRISTPREAPASAASSPRSPRSPRERALSENDVESATRLAQALAQGQAAAAQRQVAAQGQAAAQGQVAAQGQALAQGQAAAAQRQAAAQGQAAAQQPQIRVIPTPGWKPPRGAERSTALQVNPVALGRQREDLQGPASATTGQAATNKKFQVRR